MAVNGHKTGSLALNLNVALKSTSLRDLQRALDHHRERCFQKVPQATALTGAQEGCRLKPLTALHLSLHLVAEFLDPV